MVYFLKSPSHEVERFCPWLILFTHRTDVSALSSFICPYLQVFFNDSQLSEMKLTSAVSRLSLRYTDKNEKFRNGRPGQAEVEVSEVKYTCIKSSKEILFNKLNLTIGGAKVLSQAPLVKILTGGSDLSSHLCLHYVYRCSRPMNKG